MSAGSHRMPGVTVITRWPALREVASRWLHDEYAVHVVAEASSVRPQGLGIDDVIVVFPGQAEAEIVDLVRVAAGRAHVALIVTGRGLGPQVRGLQWGASAVMHIGDLDRAALLHLVGEVRAGRVVVEDGAMRRWKDVARLRAELTDRQLGIARMMESGMPTREIARRLRLTESTVKTHVARMCRRLGVPDRESLVTLLRDVSLVHRSAEPAIGSAVNGRG